MATVSVFIANFNYGRYIGKTLDSVLAQTYRDFEIVIVDDGSTDNSRDLLQDYQSRHPDKVRYSWHEGHINKGVTITSNVAIERSRGKYLAWTGSDDLWFPDKLEKQMLCFAANPDIGMVYSYANVIDEYDQPFPGLMGSDVSGNAFRKLLAGNVICASTVVIARDCLNKVGGFNESLVYSDWELFIRIAAKCRIGFVAEPLASYRVHGGNMSVHGQPLTKLARNLEVIDAVFDGGRIPDIDPALKNQALAAIYFWAALDFFVIGQAENARQYLTLSWELLNGAWPFRPDAIIEDVVALAMHSVRGSQEDKVRFVRTVFAGVAPELERRAAAHFYINNAFACNLRGDTRGARRSILKALQDDPRWLRNRGVRSIGVQALLGPLASKALKRVAGRLKPAPAFHLDPHTWR
jgi:glycosyltransferase involved in cell wall biosynthesis